MALQADTFPKGQMSEAAYQEHARGVEQTLEDLRSRMSEHEEKFNKGERQMRQLQEDVAGVRNQPSSSGVKSETFPVRDKRIEKELQRVSDELRRQ